MTIPFQDEARRGFTLALEACPSGMLLVDESGQIAYANQKAHSLFRVADGGLDGLCVDDLVPQANAAQHRALREGFFKRPSVRAMGLGRDLMARRPDGSMFPVEIGLNPFEHGEGCWVVCSVADITLRTELLKAREEARAQAMETQRLESLGLLAGGVAHDFNNLLGCVLGNATLARGLSKDASVIECLDDIVLASEQATGLARQMLAYSGRGAFSIEPLDLSRHLQGMSALLRSVVPRHIKLDFVCPADLPNISADVAQIRQIVLNLVTNAAEAIGQSAGRIRLTTGRINADRTYLKAVHPPGLSPGEYLSLEVSDDGQGMTQEVLTRVFEPFFTTRDSGSGLGMAATLGIIRAHEGGVFLYSEPGQGTTVKVLLPLSTSEVQEEEQPSLVLVADDNPGVLRFLSRALEVLGYQTVEAQDGHEAVRLFRELGHRISCVVLDVSMPFLDGPEAFEQIRELDARVPVLFSSGFSNMATTRQLSLDPYSGFLAKPFTMDTLQATLEKLFLKADNH